MSSKNDTSTSSGHKQTDNPSIRNTELAEEVKPDNNNVDIIQQSQHNPSSINRSGQSSRYCHFYVNFGNCQFEQRTGRKCKFQHKQAPLCKSGINCSRLKCMFSHPKPQAQKPFLGQQIPMMNPWQMIPPWLPQAQTQLLSSNQWGHMATLNPDQNN